MERGCMDLLNKTNTVVVKKKNDALVIGYLYGKKT